MDTHEKQDVEKIPVKDLVLWTENPRDPISSRSKNETVIRHALVDAGKKWEIKKLAKKMGARYDFSELPTVVYKNGAPIVYDGNRRVILAMLKLGLYPEFCDLKFKMPDCPDVLPCCVASEDVAIESVWRKHADTGSWDQIARDVFLYKFMKQPKSVLLQLNEMLEGRVEATSYLNQRFVREEVLTNPRMKSIGIKIEKGRVSSRHNAKDTQRLLEHIFSLVKDKRISTRNGRKEPLCVLIDPKLKAIVDADAGKEYHDVDLKSDDFQCLNVSSADAQQAARLPRRVGSSPMALFGGKLDLDVGEPANLYRDILDLYNYYEKHRDNLSDRFPALIRMALRLECELIAKCSSSRDMSALVMNGFDDAKALLSQDQKTFLAQNAVTKSNIVGLLQTGAHNYTGSYNLAQTIAMSLIVGGLLRLHCKRERGASNG